MSHRIQVYAVQNKLQLFIAKRNSVGALGDRGHLKCPRFLTFVHYPVAVAIPE